MVLCVLAIDEEDADDIALQIHFTLLQAFCCDNDVDILRLSGMRRLVQLLDGDAGTEPRDLHCILVTVSLLFTVEAVEANRCGFPNPSVCSAEPAGAAATVSGSAAGQQLLPGESRSEPVGSLSGAAGPLSRTGSDGRRVQRNMCAGRRTEPTTMSGCLIGSTDEREDCESCCGESTWAKRRSGSACVLQPHRRVRGPTVDGRGSCDNPRSRNHGTI